MFVNQGVLEPALRPSDYHSEEFFTAERRGVFGLGWHLVATRARLERPGDFVSTDVAGLPVLVRNEAGELRAFVNVCAHRQSLLEPAGCGHRDALRCRYHGWEYDAKGRVSRLPDGRSFKGLKVAGMGLRVLRVETFGPLVYVGLSPDGPGLVEALGDLGDELRPFYERPLRPVFERAAEYDVNWKVIVENAVESYHVPTVHPDTFRYYRDPSLHDHRIEASFTRYADLEPWSSSKTGVAIDAFARLLLPDADGQRFRHAHRFPNELYYFGDLFCDVSVVTPLGPRRARHASYGFIPDALRFGDWLRPVQRLWGVTIAAQGARILREDRSVWASVQAGVEHAQAPGVLSAREERIWAFQKWVANAVAG